MLLDDSLWLQFRQAKTFLLEALLNRYQPPLTHVLSAPPSRRATLRTETDKLISSLLEAEHELEAIQQEVKRVQKSISQQRGAAEMSLRPIGVLPSEVIHEIVLHTIEGTHAHHRIFCLSHVSRLWREVVIGFSALFTQANWDEWPLWLVDAWCSRAGPGLLKVCLRRSVRSAADKRALLRKLSVQVGKLQVVTSPFNGESVNDAAGDVFHLYMPSLKYLNVQATGQTASDFYVPVENVPSLRVIELTKLNPRIPTPLTGIIGLRYYPLSLHTLWHPGLEIFSKFPNLQHLALDIGDVPGINAAKTHHVILPSLISLEVRWITERPIDDILLFFGAFSLPTLQSLVLHDTFYPDNYFTSLLQSLGQQVPGLRTLYFVNDVGISTWPTVLPILTPTESRAAVFPDLQEVAFLVYSNCRRMCTNELYNLLRGFLLARTGTLTRLGIPPIDDMDILNPLRDNACLEVSDPPPYFILFRSNIVDKLFPPML